MNKEEEFQVLTELGIAIYETASEQGLASAHCIWAGNFAHKVLKCLRIQHKVVPVGAVIFNEQGWKEAGKTVSEMSPNAWNVSASRFSPNLGGWSGHLVIETPNFFFDPNSAQFVREERNILFPPFLVVPNTELISWRDTPTTPEGFTLTPPTDLWRETQQQLFEMAERQSVGFEASRAFGSYRYFPVCHYDSGTMSVYSFFRDPSNLAYQDARDWHRNWKQLGCGQAMTRIQERRREMNREARQVAQVKEVRPVRRVKAEGASVRVEGAMLDTVLHPPV